MNVSLLCCFKSRWMAKTVVDITADLTVVAKNKFTVTSFWLWNSIMHVCLQCFDAVGWAAGRASGL